LFVDEIDILVTPATMDASFDQQLRYPTKEYGAMAPESELKNYLEWMLPACLISATSAPALVLPAGKLLDGRPVGVQLVGKWGADAAVLSAAAGLEVMLGLGMTSGLDVPLCGALCFCFPLIGLGLRRIGLGLRGIGLGLRRIGLGLRRRLTTTSAIYPFHHPIPATGWKPESACVRFNSMPFGCLLALTVAIVDSLPCC
jgi:hypothetical protein